MSGMMPKMMEQMMGNSPMMGMMGMMMGKKGNPGENTESTPKMPWDMCGEMMLGLKETANSAKFATPELRDLFEEWGHQIEKETLEFIKEKNEINVDELASRFNLSEDSIKFVISRLAD